MWRKDFRFFCRTYLEKALLVFVYVFDWLYFIQRLTSFSSIDHFTLYTVFEAIWATIDELLSIKSFADQSYTGETDILVNSVTVFLLYSWLTFLQEFLTVTLTVLLFWIYSFHLGLIFVLRWLSLLWEILIKLMSRYPLTLCLTKEGMSILIELLTAILMRIWMVFMINYKMLLGWYF